MTLVTELASPQERLSSFYFCGKKGSKSSSKSEQKYISLSIPVTYTFVSAMWEVSTHL